MMGERRVAQEALFYEFSLERHVPADHLLRAIDRFVDLSGLRAHLRPFYSQIGRPSIDPELMIRMLLVGYCFGIRSERGSARRFTSTLPTAGSAVSGWRAMCPTSRASRRTGMAVSAKATCCESVRDGGPALHRRRAGRGRGLAVDASLIEADANKQRPPKGRSASTGAISPEAPFRAGVSRDAR